jgi:ferredoxin-NADP reductase
VSNIYEVPIGLEPQELDVKLLQRLGLDPKERDLKDWRGETGHIQDTFKKTFPNTAEASAGIEIYLCGWSEVIKTVCADVSAAGVPKDKLHYEEWA